MCFTLYVFKKLIENQFSPYTIRTIQTDGGGEFKLTMFRNFLKTNGIHHQFSCPHTPQQNGVVERKHRHIEEMGLCLLNHA